MNPAYYRPVDVAEALKLKSELGAGAVYLAGGTEVNNSSFPRPAALIDLSGLGLDRIEIGSHEVVLGAMVTFQQLIEHPDVPWYLKAAAGQMTNRNIRNRATLGGQLVVNRSCADLIPTLVAARVTVNMVDGACGVEQVVAGQKGLILSLVLPLSKRSFGLANHTRTAADVSIVTAACSLGLHEGLVVDPVLALGGVASRVVRLDAVERAIAGAPLPTAEKLEALIGAQVNPLDDLRGSSSFKRQIASVLGARVLRDAAGRLQTGEGV